MAARILLIISLVAAARPTLAVKIGAWMSPCSLKDPQIDQCVLTQARKVWPHLVQGVEEWGLKSSDPLLVPFVEVTTGGNAAVNMVVTAKNLTFYGLKDVQINKARVNAKTLHFEFDMLFPVMRGHDQYFISGKLLLLPISGSGRGTFNYDRVDAKLSMDYKPVVREGKKYLQLTKLDYNINSVKKASVNMENLFGKKELSDRMNKFINDNSQAVFVEMKRGVEKALGGMTFPTVDNLLQKIPLDELFTDS